ncbi:MAG: type I-B CRISPR-associated endonuclease Cas1b, partial [Candidatus Aenigmatarchaeota archaeon]
VRKIYFINNHGSLKRSKNNIYFSRSDQNIKITIPVEKIDTIISYSRLSLSSGAISLLSRKKISLHFFNKYGFYRASFYPLKKYEGEILIKQVLNFLDQKKRLYLAKKFVEGSTKNIISNMKFYHKKGRNLEGIIEKSKYFLDLVEFQDTIEKLMSIEGNIRNLYYNSFNKILPEDFKFEKRTKNPPQDMINSMISFGNSILYSTITNEIYKTSLNPSISFLHEPKNNISLSLDISEIFKPIIIDRLIFKLINKDMLNKECFIFSKGVFLNKRGRELFIEEYIKRLEKKIKIKNERVSFKKLIRREIYKLLNHIKGQEIYTPLVV